MACNVAIGQDLGLIDAAEGAALIGAGLLSVLFFPATGLALLRRQPAPHGPVGLTRVKSASG